MAPVRLLFIAVGLLLLCGSLTVVSKDCVAHPVGAAIAWRHEGGTFECTNCFGAAAAASVVGGAAGKREWKEFNNERQELNSFKEVERNGGQVFLANSAKGIHILLQNDLCGIRSPNEPMFRQLYGGSFLSVVDCTP